MYQDSASKWLYPAIITSLCQKNEATMSTRDSVIYRQNQAHLKPYTPQNKLAQPEHNQALPDHNWTEVTTNQPKRDTKSPIKLDL